jgi:hypothetical protein
MQVTTVGLDIAKNVFEIHGVDGMGRAVLRQRLSQLTDFFANPRRAWRAQHVRTHHPADGATASF